MPQLNDIIRERELGHKGTSRYIWSACVTCGKERWVQFVKGEPRRTRCGSCAAQARATRGEENPNWKGGRVKRSDGYIRVRLFTEDFFYSMADKQNYVAEHRLIMAKHLSRCLLQWEVVHHKNGVRDDNRLINLELLPSQNRHDALTKMSFYVKKLEREIERLKCCTMP